MVDSIGKVLVYGGSGVQGSAIVRAILAAGGTVRAFMPIADANPFGDAVEVARGDLADPASLARASEGVNKVVLSIPQIPFRPVVTSLARNAIAAAKDAGVKLLIWNSSSQFPATYTGHDVIDAKIDIAKDLAAAGVPWIAIRPTLFMGNLLGPWTGPGIVNDGVFAYPQPAEFKASWIAWEDLAAFITEALKRPDLAGQTFDIGGPEALTGTEMARILSEAISRPVRYLPIPTADFAASLNAAFGPSVGDNIAGVYDWSAAQPVSPMVVDLARALAAFPVKSTRFSDWAKAQNWAALAAAPVA